MITERAVAVPVGTRVTLACGCVGTLTDRIGDPKYRYGTAIQLDDLTHCKRHRTNGYIKWGAGQDEMVTYDPLAAELEAVFGSNETEEQ